MLTSVRTVSSTATIAAVAIATVLVLPTPAGAPRAEPAAPPSAGPPLWRVTNGEHTLWLFGTVSTVPKDLAWDPRAVEAAVASSQEVLLPPGARAAVSLKPVQLLRAWRRARELGRNPQGSALSDVLPPELEQRYAALRDRYAEDGRA